MTCSQCSQPATRSLIQAGAYFPNLCLGCFRKRTKPTVSTASPRYDRQIDLEDNQDMALQPFNPDGSPSQDFAKRYPEKANAYFTPEDLRQSIRDSKA